RHRAESSTAPLAIPVSTGSRWTDRFHGWSISGHARSVAVCWPGSHRSGAESQLFVCRSSHPRTAGEPDGLGKGATAPVELHDHHRVWLRGSRAIGLYWSRTVGATARSGLPRFPAHSTARIVF